MKTTIQKPFERPSRTHAHARTRDAVTPSAVVRAQFSDDHGRPFGGVCVQKSKPFARPKRDTTLSDSVPLNVRRYILKTRDGDYVQSVEANATATLKSHFNFTQDREKAQRFSYAELWDQSTLAVEFACGFSGSRAERIR
jgi:hypothetical protein